MIVGMRKGHLVPVQRDLEVEKAEDSQPQRMMRIEEIPLSANAVEMFLQRDQIIERERPRLPPYLR